MNAHGLTCFEVTAYECIWFVSDCLMDALYLALKQIFIMDLVIHDAHIIHYHMNPLWSVSLGHNYITHLDYMVIHCWIHTTLLFQLILL